MAVEEVGEFGRFHLHKSFSLMIALEDRVDTSESLSLLSFSGSWSAAGVDGGKNVQPLLQEGSFLYDGLGTRLETELMTWELLLFSELFGSGIVPTLIIL